MRFGHLLGTHPSQSENYFDTVLAVAQASEKVGLDAVFYSDHFQYQRHTVWTRGLRLLAAALHRRVPDHFLVQKLEMFANWFAVRYDADPRRTLFVLGCFTALAAIAAATQRIRLGALVAGAPYRNPALLAKMNITLDVISHGRCIIGLGAGWHEEEFKASFGRLLEFVRTEGRPVSDDQLVGSDLILPPPDVSVQEARAEFTGEGLIPG